MLDFVTDKIVLTIAKRYSIVPKSDLIFIKVILKNIGQCICFSLLKKEKEENCTFIKSMSRLEVLKEVFEKVLREFPLTGSSISLLLF